MPSPSMPASREPTTADPATRLVEAVVGQDFEALESLLAPNVWFRVLLPRRIEEGTTAAAAIAAFRRWFSGAAAFVPLARHRHESRGSDACAWAKGVPIRAVWKTSPSGCGR